MKKSKEKIKDLTKGVKDFDKLLHAKKDVDDLKEKLMAIAKILGEPIDVNVGIETINGKDHIKILNVATKTGLEMIKNPLTKLIQPLQQMREEDTEGQYVPSKREKRKDYIG